MGLSLSLPPKQPGQARPRLGKQSCHPPPSQANRGRLPSPSLFGKRAAPPAREPGTRLRAPLPQPAPPNQPGLSPRPGPARGPARPRAAAAAAGRAPAAPGSGGSGLPPGRRGPQLGPRATEAARARAAFASAPGRSPGPRPPSRPPAQPAPRRGRKKCRRREAWSPACRQAPPSGLAAAQREAFAARGTWGTGTDRRRALRSSRAAEATHSSNCLRGPTPPARPHGQHGLPLARRHPGVVTFPAG